MDAQFLAHFGLTQESWEALPFIERVLYRAAYDADVLHVREAGPPFENRGELVESYQAAAGINPGDPWCMAWITAKLLDSGAKRDELPLLAGSVHGTGEWAEGKGLDADDPFRGAVGLIYESDTAGHAVLITSANAGYVYTIEGNTNPGGSREGYGVFRRCRPITEFALFVDFTGLG